MPLPLVPALAIGAALLAGAYGVKKGIDAYSDNEEADELNEEAQTLLNKAERRLKHNRNNCKKRLEELGRLKFTVWDRQLGRFVSLFEQIRGVDVTGVAAADKIDWSQDELEEMKQLSGYAAEIVAGGFGAIGTGALVGMASYGGATMLASASTGTAISSLAGVAATNATLAWFGGGSLVAGGLGMAGGVAVLGGIVAGPVLAVAGGLMAAKARESLANARGNYALATEQEAEMDTAGAVVNGIHRVAGQVIGVISAMDERMTPVLDRLAFVIETHGTDFQQYPDDAKRHVYIAVQFAKCLKGSLETPILTKDGAVDDGYRKPLEQAQKFLEG